MLRPFGIAIALLLTVGVRAQQATYFPHHLGDMWEYFVLDGVGNDTLQVRVIFDSTDPGGSSHVRHHRRLVNPNRPPWFSWYDQFRIDTTRNVFGSGGIFTNSLLFKLNAVEGQWWIVNYLGGPSADVAKVQAVYPDTLFEIPTTVIQIAYYGTQDTSDTTIWLWQYTEILAAGFGTIFRGDGDLGYNLYLRGCVIDGVFYGDTMLVSVPESNNDYLPTDFTLYQNFPNPFNPQTTIPFDLPHTALVRLVIYDILGNVVRQLVEDQTYQPGTHQITWDGKTPDGSQAATGVYIVRIEASGRTSAKRMLLLR